MEADIELHWRPQHTVSVKKVESIVDFQFFPSQSMKAWRSFGILDSKNTENRSSASQSQSFPSLKLILAVVRFFCELPNIVIQLVDLQCDYQWYSLWTFTTTVVWNWLQRQWWSKWAGRSRQGGLSHRWGFRAREWECVSTHEAVEAKDDEELSATVSAAQGVHARSIPRRRFVRVTTQLVVCLLFTRRGHWKKRRDQGKFVFLSFILCLLLVNQKYDMFFFEITFFSLTYLF